MDIEDVVRMIEQRAKGYTNVHMFGCPDCKKPTAIVCVGERGGKIAFVGLCQDENCDAQGVYYDLESIVAIVTDASKKVMN